jgi:DNA invertase Pin-like site-specific DNA recombinase
MDSDRLQRVALYARYSSDAQSEASIDDQLRICRVRAEREGWQVAGVYTDAAISGATSLRPGYQDLLVALRGGGLDFVLAESLDRFSRDQEHIAAFYKQAMFAGVRIVTLAEGEVSELHIGLKGTMGALYLKDLADKTRRGMEGRIRQGRSIGQASYGYKVVRSLGIDGEPDRGKRTIAPDEAAVVRRIFRDYAAGVSPLAIARALNRDGIPGPAGGLWFDPSIRGRSGRGDGILRNEIYIGRLVWNRRRNVKDPLTGRIVRRRNELGAIVVSQIPELRIIEQELWDRVQARLRAESLPAGPAAPNPVGPFWEHRRPRFLLTGKVVCGACGQLFATIGRDYLGCRAARQGICRNTTAIRRSKLEARVLDGLARQLMRPDLVKEFVATFIGEWNRLVSDASSTTEVQQRELRAIERKIANLVDAISEGARGAAVHQRLHDLESRRAELQSVLRNPPAPLPALHPNLAEVYRAKVTTLQQTLGKGANPETLEAARALIDRVIVSPPCGGGEPPVVELVGELAASLRLGVSNDNSAAESTQAAHVLGVFASSVKKASGA